MVSRVFFHQQYKSATFLKSRIAQPTFLLEDSEQRWQRRFEDAKRQEDASHARLATQESH